MHWIFWPSNCYRLKIIWLQILSRFRKVEQICLCEVPVKNLEYLSLDSIYKLFDNLYWLNGGILPPIHKRMIIAHKCLC